MIEGLFKSGAMPVLERMIQFTSARQKLIAHNIANLDTPNFQPADLNVSQFQQALAQAIDRRRAEAAGSSAPLELRDTPDLHFGPSSITARPRPTADNILFHDRNNRSLEDQMKDLAENAMAHNNAMELLRHEFAMLDTAIKERL